MAVFGSGDDLSGKVGKPEAADVVNDDDIGVEVNDAFDVRGKDIGEVDAGVVKGLVEGLADRTGDPTTDAGGVEAVDAEVEEREGGADGGGDVGFDAGSEEVEGDVFGAGGVLKDRKNGGYGAAEVVSVEGHGDVDVVERGAFVGVAEGRGFTEVGNGDRRGGAADDIDADAGVRVREWVQNEEEEEKEEKSRGDERNGHCPAAVGVGKKGGVEEIMAREMRSLRGPWEGKEEGWWREGVGRRRNAVGLGGETKGKDELDLDERERTGEDEWVMVGEIYLFWVGENGNCG